MGYIFRLAKVLKVKENEEKLAKEELTAMRNTLINEQEKLNTIHDELNILKHNWFSQSSTRLNIEALKDNLNYSSLLQIQYQHQEKAVEVINKHVELCVIKAQSKIQDRKILEKFNEQKKRDFYQEEKRQEQLFIDEMSNRHLNI